MTYHRVSFSTGDFAPVEVAHGVPLSEKMNAVNSPLLFGCRTGICGTCAIEVTEGELEPPTEEEQEILSIHAPNNPKARLACQIEVNQSFICKPLE